MDPPAAKLAIAQSMAVWPGNINITSNTHWGLGLACARDYDFFPDHTDAMDKIMPTHILIVTSKRESPEDFERFMKAISLINLPHYIENIQQIEYLAHNCTQVKPRMFPNQLLLPWIAWTLFIACKKRGNHRQECARVLH